MPKLKCANMSFYIHIYIYIYIKKAFFFALTLESFNVKYILEQRIYNHLYVISSFCYLTKPVVIYFSFDIFE